MLGNALSSRNLIFPPRCIVLSISLSSHRDEFDPVDPPPPTITLTPIIPHSHLLTTGALSNVDKSLFMNPFTVPSSLEELLFSLTEDSSYLELIIIISVTFSLSVVLGYNSGDEETCQSDTVNRDVQVHVHFSDSLNIGDQPLRTMRVFINPFIYSGKMFLV